MHDVTSAELGQMIIEKVKKADTIRKFAGCNTIVQLEIDGKAYRLVITPQEHTK